MLMERLLKLAASIVIALILSQEIARADFWVRTDRPWSYWELKHAIHYCRIRPRVTDDYWNFIDVLKGQQIDRCMYMLGWIGAVR